MAIKSVLTNQTDFTGEIPATPNTGALWRFNEAAPDNLHFTDSSGHNRVLTASGWAGTTAQMIAGKLGQYYRQNTNVPTTEKSYLTATNDGSFWANLGGRVVVAGWISPATYSIGQTYSPIFNTRQGPGQPLIYLSLYQGRPRVMLYNNAGTAIFDQAETPSFTMSAGGWYLIAAIVDTVASTSQVLLCNRADGQIWEGPLRTYSGTLNAACTANVVLGMHADTYYYAGGLDDWFFETNSDLTVTDLEHCFRNALMANGADNAADVDALTEPGAVTLKKTGSTYPASGTLITVPAPCSVSGDGRVSVASEYTQGVTAISLVETSTSDDYVNWSPWVPLGINGELNSPNAAFIRYRVTLTTSNPAQSPKLLDITLNDIPKPPYERLGFARPVVLDADGAWEAVLENAFDVIVIGEVNGADTLQFSLPFSDPKRVFLDNEKQIQIAGEIYRVRTVTDEKTADNNNGVLTTVYAEAAFYDLTFSVGKEPVEFNAALPVEPISYALTGTGWSVGTIDVTTLRTWNCEEKNALAVLRMTAQIHGGDLIFDSRNKQVSLLQFSGKDSGALFSYRKNLTGIKRVIDTRSLVTRLFAVGKDGMTFASINHGRPYVEDFSFTNEIRVSTLDCSNFTNPYQMLEFTNMRLGDYARPRISYVLNAMDLSVLTGYEHEAWDLGDIVTVDDRDLGLTIKTRVIRREYNLQEPWKTVIELSTKLRELGDTSGNNLADDLGQAGLIGQEIKDLVPFNLLRNSRADSGFAYWQNSGFEIDTDNGVTSTSSFKATGGLGQTKSLAQTVYPANRRNYTISAQIGSEDLHKGPNGQVGIELVFQFEDGSEERRFIDLY